MQFELTKNEDGSYRVTATHVVTETFNFPALDDAVVKIKELEAGNQQG